MNDSIWRKSSRSDQVNCIEVSLRPGETAVRDSKDPKSSHLVIGSSSWGSFLGCLKAGRFDRDLD
ncbi:DUF397 domain-containing protein [Saccharopolyspora halophila]|uniref:DUF397 domain-containing protein n=1 Tax=Saccharopolyspora halophila TaxID=405551 RepID=UPI0031E059DB